MQLETADRTYESIDDYTIAEAVRAVADLKTEFAILSLDDGSFMQTAGGTAGRCWNTATNCAGGHLSPPAKTLCRRRDRRLRVPPPATSAYKKRRRLAAA
ncbi:MAG: hypothetical protein R3C45_15970 [Phycisphaerales bacterium]